MFFGCSLVTLVFDSTFVYRFSSSLPIVFSWLNSVVLVFKYSCFSKKSFILFIYFFFFCDGQIASILESLTHLLVWVEPDDGY